MRIILAHGILGPLDELFYLSPGIIFMFTMLLGWLRSRIGPSRIPVGVDKPLTKTSAELEGSDTDAAA